jgi:hypothetical protein
MNYVKLGIVALFFHVIVVAGGFGSGDENRTHPLDESSFAYQFRAASIPHIPHGLVAVVPAALVMQPLGNFSVSTAVFPHATGGELMPKIVEYVVCCCECVPDED